MSDLGKYLTELPEALTLDDDDILYTVVGSGTTTSKKVKKSTILSADRTARATAEGTIVANFASPYSTITQYAVGDYCIKDLVLYKCISPTSGTWDSSKWTQVTALDLTSGVASDLSDEIEARQSADETLQGEIDEVVADVNAVETALETKAEKNGVYDDLVAGNLLSDSYTADNAPYLYRQSPSASSVEQNIVGGTVAWNQLVQNGNFADTSKWGTYGTSTSASNNELTATVTTAYEASGNNIVYNSHSSTIVGHKYFYSCDLFVPSTNNTLTTVKCGLRGTNLVSSTQRDTWETIRRISTVSSSNNIFVIASGSSTTVGDIFRIRKVNVIDLTQMFGSTIADYIYSLEQATVGSGIAWLKSYGFLTKSYYAYQSGKLESVNVASRKIVGKNLFDEANPDKWIFADGNLTDDVGSMTSQLIKAKEGQTYILSSANSTSTLCICFYDSEMNLLNRTAMASVGQLSATAPSNSVYMYASSFKSHNNLQLEFGSTATAYEPYKEVSYPLNTGDLRGLFKLNGDKLVADGDVRKSDSQNTRYGIVNLGSLDYTYYSTSDGNLFRSTISDMVTTTGTTLNVLCPKYIAVPQSDRTNGTITSSANTKNIDIIDNNYTDATTFKNAMNGIYLLYPLATPTTESATPFENPQLVFSGGTEEFIDGATRDVAIPVGQDSKYYLDIKGKVEQLYGIPEPPSTNGTYTLKATRSASGVTYAWVSG